MLVNKVHHVAITCRDYEESKAFYISVLGFEILHEVYFAERGFYKLALGLSGVLQLELFYFPSIEIEQCHSEMIGVRHLAFEVNSVKSVLQELQVNGIKAEGDGIRLDQTSGKKFAFIKDPNGVSIELYEK